MPARPHLPNLCAACAADPDSASKRGARTDWVFALAHPGQPVLTFVGMSRFPALRCAQIVVDLVLEGGRRGKAVPVACDAWAVEVPERLAAARDAGINGEPVSLQPTLAEWNKSGQ